MTVKLSISLTDQQAAYARKQVEEGRFPSTSAVLQQALEAKRREDEQYEDWKDGFFDMLAERAKGPFLNEEESQKAFDEMIGQKRRQYGLDD